MSIRRWFRKADHDLIERMAAGVTQPKKNKPKSKNRPRSVWTYRGFWRNAWRKA